MKAASDLLQLIDKNVRIEEVEEDGDYDDIPLSHLVRVPEVLQQNTPPAEVVIPDDDEPYAEDPDAPAPEVNRMSPPPVPRGRKPRGAKKAEAKCFHVCDGCQHLMVEASLQKRELFVLLVYNGAVSKVLTCSSEMTFASMWSKV
eukprot:g75254.t1